MKTNPKQDSVEGAMTAMKFENPLGLRFETPKSEENLRSATIYDAADRAPNAERPVNTEVGAVSPWGTRSFTISQILG